MAEPDTFSLTTQPDTQPLTAQQYKGKLLEYLQNYGIHTFDPQDQDHSLFDTLEYLISPNIKLFEKRDAEDYFCLILAGPLSIRDKEPRDKAIEALRNYVSSLGDNPEAVKFQQIMDKFAEYDFSNVNYSSDVMNPGHGVNRTDEIYFILQKAWFEEDNSYLNLALKDHVVVESAVDQPLKASIQQRSYESCQILAAIDNISRMPGGVEYLNSLVKDYGDGTYDVTLYQDGKGILTHVDLTKNPDFGPKFNLTDPVSSNAPVLVQAIERAYIQNAYDKATSEGSPVSFDGNCFAYTTILPQVDEKVSVKATDFSAEMLKKINDEHGVVTLTFNMPVELIEHGFDMRGQHVYSASIDCNGIVSIRAPDSTNVVLQIPLDALKDGGDYAGLNAQFHIAYSEKFGKTLDDNAKYAGMVNKTDYPTFSYAACTAPSNPSAVYNAELSNSSPMLP
jgi:hypothetical protein